MEFYKNNEPRFSKALKTLAREVGLSNNLQGSMSTLKISDLGGESSPSSISNKFLESFEQVSSKENPFRQNNLTFGMTGGAQQYQLKKYNTSGTNQESRLNDEQILEEADEEDKEEDKQSTMMKKSINEKSSDEEIAS